MTLETKRETLHQTSDVRRVGNVHIWHPLNHIASLELLSILMSKWPCCDGDAWPGGGERQAQGFQFV